MEQVLSRIGANKSILVFLSIVGLVSSIYGYYQLLTIVPVFADILAAFETNLTATTQFIIQTHNYYVFLSVIGLLALVLPLLDKVNILKGYLLVASNLLLMFGVRWLTANELNQSILTMGLLQ